MPIASRLSAQCELVSSLASSTCKGCVCVFLVVLVEPRVAPACVCRRFRLCWCAAGFSCDEPTAARVDFGEFTVVGPAPLRQDRTCVGGRACSADGVTGLLLRASDSVLVLETCGVRTHVEKLPQGGLHRLTGSGGMVTAPLDWGGEVLTSFGGPPMRRSERCTERG